MIFKFWLYFYFYFYFFFLLSVLNNSTNSDDVWKMAKKIWMNKLINEWMNGVCRTRILVLWVFSYFAIKTVSLLLFNWQLFIGLLQKKKKKKTMRTIPKNRFKIRYVFLTILLLMKKKRSINLVYIIHHITFIAFFFLLTKCLL